MSWLLFRTGGPACSASGPQELSLLGGPHAAPGAGQVPAQCPTQLDRTQRVEKRAAQRPVGQEQVVWVESEQAPSGAQRLCNAPGDHGEGAARLCQAKRQHIVLEAYPLARNARERPMLHGHGDTVARRGVKGVEAVPAHQVLLPIRQLLVREEEPCQPEVEVAG